MRNKSTTTPFQRLSVGFVLFLGLLLSLAACEAAPDTDQPAGDAPTTEIDPEDTDNVGSDGGPADDGAGHGNTSDDGSGDGDAALDEGMEQESGELAAIVNGEPIMLADFQAQAFDTQRFFVEQGLDPNTEEGQAQLKALRKQVIDDMINQRLIEQFAAEQNITVDEAAIDERIAIYIEQAGGEEAFEANLEETGTSRDALREMERQALVGQRVLDLIAGGSMNTAEHRRARHILCDTREACESARERIQSGESFADVAEDVSTDVTTASSGGDLDWLAIGTVPSPALEDAVFSLEPNQLSDVIETDFGFHLIEVLEIDPDRPLSEEQQFGLREKRLLDWLGERRAESDVEIMIPDLADPS